MDQPESLLKGRSNQQRQEDAANRKKVFLSSYSEHGTIRLACAKAGISRETYRRWQGADYDFARHFDLAKQEFAESLEEIAFDRVRNPNGNKGSDVLLLGLLNANWKEKYRPQFAMTEDTAKDLILEWRKSIKEAENQPQANLPEPVEKELSDILERRTSAIKKRDIQEDGESEHSEA